MADLFVGSTKWTAVTAWAASTAYVVGDLRRQLATPTVGNERVFRCTTAGTSGGAEPTWTITSGGTTADNTAAWTEVTGSSTYNTTTNFAAPFARLRTAVSLKAAAGDRIFLSNNHAATETPGSTITISVPGTLAAPCQIICVNDSTGAISTGATETFNYSQQTTINGHLYCYGLATIMSGSNGVGFGQSAGDVQLWEQCQFQLTNASITPRITFGSNGGVAQGEIRLINCSVKFGHANQNITVYATKFDSTGLTLLSGGTSPTALFNYGSSIRGAGFTCSGFDISNASAGVHLTAAAGSAGDAVFMNGKLPTSWSGSVVGTTPPAVGNTYTMWNCDAADTNYRFWRERYTGSIKSETVIVRTGGASDGTTPISWKMASAANAEYPLHLLKSLEITDWIDTTGSSKTLTVEIVHDSQGAGTGSAFLDDEIWLEVQYLGTSGFPLGTLITDAKASVIATAADQASSSETWTTTGLTTPVKQALSVTFTPQEKGFYIARVVLAKASKTVYVDPKVAVA